MRFHCTALALAFCLVSAGLVRAQTVEPVPGDAAFGVYIRGTQIGREDVRLARTDSGWVITSTGRSGPPIDLTINRFDMKYGRDWQPLEMTLELRSPRGAVLIRTSFSVTTAINEITQGNQTAGRNDQISARTIVLPTNVFAACEALAVRLAATAEGAELPIYGLLQNEVKARVNRISGVTLTRPGGAMPTRRYDLSIAYSDRVVAASVAVDDRLRLVRFEVPEVGLLVAREDVSSVSVRAEAARNPTDADVSVPANGFNLGGTLTTPPKVAGRLRHPAVVLVGGASPSDRDQVIDGVPVFAQLARALADSGHLVVRYDRRGTGQSGGRIESVTLSDYADDVVSIVNWLQKRDDVDKQHIVVVGHMDGGPVALIAASRAKAIDGVVTIDAAGTSGADLILLQQQRVLDEMKLSPADRQARVELQKKIQAAVVSGAGWEGVPEPMRRQADTPWFKSVLTYDPAKIVPKVKQPILILHGDLDVTVPPAEADRLAALARGRKKGTAELVHLRDVNQALVKPQTTSVSPTVATTIAEWIKKL